ncbi:MAG: GNAT family N-acetyltransferase [archaeon]|nr:GNAT family N-acetyltransferase [archaeon]
MFSPRLATLNDIEELINLRIIFLREAEEINEEIISKKLEKLKNSIRYYFQDKISSGDFISWIMINNDEIIATSGMYFRVAPPNFSNLSGKEAYIMNIYTNPKWRKKGIATSLLNKNIDDAIGRGIEKIFLHTTEYGKSIYLKRGFQFHGDEMRLKLLISD